MDMLNYELSETMHKFRNLFQSMPFENLSHGEFFLLNVLKSNSESECIGVMKLAEDMGISGPAVSRTLGNLEKRGLINRNIDTENRRNIIVSISDDGEKVLKQAHRAVELFMENVIEQMGEENVREMSRLMKTMCETIETKTKGREDIAND